MLGMSFLDFSSSQAQVSAWTKNSVLRVRASAVITHVDAAAAECAGWIQCGLLRAGFLSMS